MESMPLFPSVFTSEGQHFVVPWSKNALKAARSQFFILENDRAPSHLTTSKLIPILLNRCVYAIHSDEDINGSGGVGSRSRRQEISSSSVSTLTPVFSMSIICSRLNPACSPAMASLLTALTKAEFAIVFPPVDEVAARITQ